MRLDQLLVDRGLAASRAEGARLVLAGRVRLGQAVLDKAGHLVASDAAVEVSAAPRYVGRGGEKLAAALAALGITVRGRVCVDVGASTGGFTDCLLAHGARRVFAVDVGHGQLHPRLRADPRVTVLEGVNARSLDPGRFDEPPELATVDVSFISLEKVLPAVAACLSGSGAAIVALVKPQFEVGRGQVGRGGVVRDANRHREVLRRVAGFAHGHGLGVRGMVASPLRGPKGNREFFLHLAGGAPGLDDGVLEAAVVAAVGGDDAGARGTTAREGAGR